MRIFASGRLSAPDRVALALCLGADAVNIARGLMIAAGCIQSQKCHTNQCPVGVATTDPELMKALVIEEKQYRVCNYVVSLRAGLFSLAAAAGLRSPVEFARRHAVYRDELGRSRDRERRPLAATVDCQIFSLPAGRCNTQILRQ